MTHRGNVTSNSNTITVTATTTETSRPVTSSTRRRQQVNPMTREVLTPVLKQFVVMQDVTLTAGPDTITISPTIYGPGSPYQNVDALPLSGAVITLFPGTTSPQGKSGAQKLAHSP